MVPSSSGCKSLEDETNIFLSNISKFLLDCLASCFSLLFSLKKTKRIGLQYSLCICAVILSYMCCYTVIYVLLDCHIYAVRLSYMCC